MGVDSLGWGIHWRIHQASHPLNSVRKGWNLATDITMRIVTSISLLLLIQGITALFCDGEHPDTCGGRNGGGGGAPTNRRILIPDGTKPTDASGVGSTGTSDTPVNPRQRCYGRNPCQGKGTCSNKCCPLTTTRRYKRICPDCC